MDVLTHAADNFGIKKLSQFMGEVHCCRRLPTITVIPRAVEGSRCEIFKVTPRDPSSPSRTGVSLGMTLFPRVFPRHRSDVWDFPARSRKCFNHRDHHDDEKSQMDERLNDGPEENQQAA
jgi:hypothetical protein